MRLFYICFCFFSLLTFNFQLSTAQTLPRIAVAGISIESSTFSPAVSTEDMFRKRTGEALLDSYAFLRPGMPVREAARWLPVMVAAATPGGAVTRQAYESLTGQILDGLRDAGPIDGLLLDIHGAMSVVGMDDPEGDLIVRIREVIGHDVHGHSRQPHDEARRKYRPDNLLPARATRRQHGVAPTGRGEPARQVDERCGTAEV